jgi:hypothetical protein
MSSGPADAAGTGRTGRRSGQDTRAAANRPPNAHVRPARPPTPLPGYDARVGGSARRVAATARRTRCSPAAGNRGRWTFTRFRRQVRPRSSGRVGPAIADPRDLTPHAETSVDAAGPGRQASRTCPRYRDSATGDAGGGSVPPATARDPERIAHSPRAHSPCRSRGSSTPGAGHSDALSLLPARSPSASGLPWAPEVRVPGAGGVCPPLIPVMPSAPAHTHWGLV